MINIKRWKLTNIVYYERASVQVKAPLVVVRGRNLSSKVRGQNNGAGKSLLCFPVPNILRGSPPISAKKKGRKDILGKKSCAFIEFVTHSNKKIEIYQYAGKYEVVEDGKDLEVKSIPTAEKMIQDYFPLNEQEFYSTFYIRTIPLEFQIGTPSDRLKFLSDLFRLDSYDELRKHFAEQLKKVKDEETKYTLLSSSLAKVEKELTTLNWSASKKEELSFKSKQLEDISAKIRVILDKKHEQETLLVNIETANSLHKQLLDLGYKPSLKVKEKLEALQELEAKLTVYYRYVSDLHVYKKSTQKIKEDLKQISLPEESKKVLSSRLKELDSKLVELRKELAELQEAHDDYIEYKTTKSDFLGKLKELGFSPKSVPDLDVEEELAQVRTVLSLKNLLHDHSGEKKCPTCLSDIDINAIRSSVKAAEKKLDSLTNIRNAQKIAKKLFYLEKVDFDIDELNKCKKSVSKLEKQLNETEEAQSLYKEHDRLTSILNEIVAPERVEKPETNHSSESLTKSISALHKMRSLLKSYNRVKESAELEDDLEEHEASINKRLKNLKLEEKELEKKSDKLTDTVRELEQGLAQFKLLYSQSLDLKQQMSAIQADIGNKQILEALVNAYGPKGLKIRAIKNICSMLEANFNVYSQYIYNEDFKFKITVEPTGILVDVDRGRDFVSDVRMLSGAESDCFKLMFLTSLLPLMPSERRTNLLILDEPDSHMDPVVREKFIHDFLPQLQTVVPHIIVITPNDDSYDGAEEWIVTKDGKKSELTVN